MSKLPSVHVTLTCADPDGGLTAGTLAQALGVKLADLVQQFADARAKAGQGLTAAELDKTLLDAMSIVQRSCAASLGARQSPGIALVVTATRTRDATAAKRQASSTTNINLNMPELVEVETDAKFDQAGRMVGTVTKKARVR